VSEPYDYRAPAPAPPGRPQGWSGTSRMPTQAPPEYGYPPVGPPQRTQQPRDPERRAKIIDYGLKGLGLLGVALVSGLLWYLIRNNPAPAGGAAAPPPSQTAGLYQFPPYQPAATESDCAGHATNKVRFYLQQHPCVSLTRSLYTTSLADSQKVVTSIAVVRMDTAAAARGLQQESDGNGTGHVKDLVEDGVVIPGGPKSLQDGGYYSAVRGNRVIIAETEYVDGTQDTPSNLNSNNHMLLGVSQDAVKQGIGLG
jgi:hypothetical protein